ncbi:MAG: cytochrome c oxidase subunit 3 [Chlamydiales bacterium]|nr:cytochrome c oxidase subunit 3 [Chlamydiales bacterium]
MNVAHESYPDTHHDAYSRATFGFWVYLLTDFIFLSTIFACYAVLSKNTFGGLTPRDIFSLPFSTVQTFVMLCIAFTAGVLGAYAHRKSKGGVITFTFLTFLLGLVFLGMMGHEFSHIFAAGYSWKSTAFLSMYFSLIGMFGLHVIFGLLWIIVLIVPVFKEGVTAVSIRRLTCLRMFWQFINIVWVLIFTFVYVLGVI